MSEICGGNDASLAEDMTVPLQQSHAKTHKL